MPAPTPKSDQLRALREAKALRAPVKVVLEKVAKAALSKVNVDKREYNRAAQEKWRAANTDLHRKRSRASMRKLRAQAKV